MKLTVGIPKPSMEALESDANASKTDSAIDAMFNEIVAAFKQKFGPCYDLSHMKCLVSPIPMNHDGDPKTNEADKVKYTGSWTKLDTVYVNPDMTKAMEFYGITGQVTQEDLQKQVIAHELAHEIWEYMMDDNCKSKILKKAKDLTFDTPYLHHIDDDDPDEELFCEYMAYRVTGVWVKIIEKQVAGESGSAEAGNEGLFGSKENNIKDIQKASVSKGGAKALVAKIDGLDEADFKKLLDSKVTRFYKFSFSDAKKEKECMTKAWDCFLKFYAPVIDKMLALTEDDIEKKSAKYTKVMDEVAKTYTPTTHNSAFEKALDALPWPREGNGGGTLRNCGFSSKETFKTFVDDYIEARYGTSELAMKWWAERQDAIKKLGKNCPYQVKDMAKHLRIANSPFNDATGKIFLPDLKMTVEKLSK